MPHLPTLSRVTDSLVWQNPFVFHVGDVVRKRREARHWTGIQLAAKAGVSKMTVSRIERGLNYTREKLERIAKALGATVAELEAETRSDPRWHGDGVKPAPQDGAPNAGNVAGLLAAREGERRDLLLVFSAIFARLAAGQPLDEVLQAAADRSRRGPSHRSAR